MTITRKLPTIDTQEPPQTRYSLFAHAPLAEQRQHDQAELARAQERIEALLQAMPERQERQ